MKVKINKEEFELLSSGQLLPDDLRRKVIKGASLQNNGIHILEVSDDDADLIRDYCGDQLQKIGFDENYDPTKEGRILESLIDKLFVK